MVIKFYSLLALTALSFAFLPALPADPASLGKLAIITDSNNTNPPTKQNTNNKKCITWQYFVSNFKEIEEKDFDLYSYISLPMEIPSKYSKGCVAILNVASAAIEIGVFENGVQVISNNRRPYSIPMWDEINMDYSYQKRMFKIIRMCLSYGARSLHFCQKASGRPFVYNFPRGFYGLDRGVKGACLGPTCLYAPGIQAENLLRFWRNQLNYSDYQVDEVQ